MRVKRKLEEEEEEDPLEEKEEESMRDIQMPVVVFDLVRERGLLSIIYSGFS